ncbi:FtsQ-type POTRA domain-containing protein [Bifidobacterium sp. H1HS16N]|uniref:FtsQ-type POTRA domain-containing protein n=1 Tax=Bifidobacterium kimbladii TaxID=1293826 RepID=A0ABU3KGK4_9BIFI|nr:FtsQ-type POTRA domain-containing protein [Bifidobacterium sp. H1HS16N]MDT7509739.1 FtsQ-type POTRA domain-containing protein [Bifidobacterium sp. H1HS16N]
MKTGKGRSASGGASSRSRAVRAAKAARTARSGRTTKPLGEEPQTGRTARSGRSAASDAAGLAGRRSKAEKTGGRGRRLKRSKRLKGRPNRAKNAGGSRTRSPRSASSSSRSLVKGSSASASKSVTSKSALSRSTTSAGGFVDARTIPPDRPVSGRIGTDQEDQGLGIFVRPKVLDFQARVREKKKVSRRLVLIRTGVALLVMALIAGLSWLLFLSPVFRLQTEKIDVSGGNAWVSNDRVASIVAHQGDRSLLLISTNGVEQEISGMAGVTDAKVRKSFPHGLEVTFDAQEPTAVFKDAQDKLTAVDRQGRVLNTVSKPVKGVPVIQVSTVNRAQQDQAVRQTLRILSTMPEAMRHSVTKVTAETQDSITTELDQGNHVIIWGDGSDLKLKQAVVDKIINDPTKIGDKHQLDVSAPLRPIVK